MASDSDCFIVHENKKDSGNDQRNWFLTHTIDIVRLYDCITLPWFSRRRPIHILVGNVDHEVKHEEDEIDIAPKRKKIAPIFLQQADAKSILSEVFGFKSFRSDVQENAVRAILKCEFVLYASILRYIFSI